MEVQETEVQTDRVLTVPNLLSFLRLLGVPLFLWLILVPKADGWAIVLLIFAGLSDYLDGKIARRWNQISRLGQLLDPLADRLYILGPFHRQSRDFLPSLCVSAHPAGNWAQLDSYRLSGIRLGICVVGDRSLLVGWWPLHRTGTADHSTYSGSTPRRSIR